MQAEQLIGSGVGFAVVGAIFWILSTVKPDLAFFKKSANEAGFYRRQGLAVGLTVFGVLTLIVGAMVAGDMVDASLPATMLGVGVALLLAGAILGLLSVLKPDMNMFKRNTPAQFHRSQGLYVMFVAFGLIYVILGAAGLA